MKALLLTALLLPCRAAAQEYGAGFGRFLGYNEDRARYSTTEQFGDRGPFIWRQEADAAWTVLKSTPDAWTVSARATELELGSNVYLPQNGALVPRKLWGLQGGGGYVRELGDRRRWGANTSLGSSSDRPFLSWREDQVTASAYYQLPSLERNSWVLLLNYSNNRSFANGVPLPGFAYIIDAPAYKLDAVVGFPFLFLRWRPMEEWTLSGGVFGTASWFMEVSRKLGAGVSLFARLDRAPQQWLRSTREASSDRLIYDSKQAALGARARLGRGLSADLSVGRVFDRRFFEGRDASRSGSVPQAALANAVTLQTSISYRWGAPTP